MKIQAGEKLLFIGDSITDCGRGRPVGEVWNGGVGNGYVALVDGLLNEAYPERSIRVLNTGISGNTVRDLDARWTADVLDLAPDWVAVMIGANDVWRQFDCQRQKDWHIPLDEYEATYDALVERTLPRVKGMLLMTPYFNECCREDAMRRRMDEYGAAVKRIAAKRGTLLADTQAAMDRQLEHHYSAVLGWDRVHTNHLSAMALAFSVVDALGYRRERTG